MNKEIINFKLPELSFHISTISAANKSKIRDSHSHRAIELVMLNSGKMHCYIENKVIPLEIGKVLLINSYVIHKLVNVEDSNITYIQIDINKHLKHSHNDKSSYINEYLTQAFSMSYYMADSASILTQIFNDMKNEIESQDKGYDLFLKSNIIRLIAFMNRNDIINSPSLHSLSNINKIMPVIKHIEQNYSQKIHLDELAKLIYCDKYSLCRFFKNATSGTVIEYINFVRLRKAEELLSKSNKTLIEIAFDSGFSSIQYFNKVFKKYNGYSPSKFKKLTI